ncbi:MAG: serine/threonine-protein kinase [Persicimonas sp.]
MSESDPIVEPGMVLADRYEVTEEIGRGGFGRIYRARQINVDRDVAVKVLPPKFISTHGVVERFRREARLASRLRHPNTITVHDYGKQDDLLFIVMEYLQGEDLADLLRRRSTLPLAMILHVSRQVLKSLQEAHTHQIVHRDLKPENVFLTQVGSERDFVKVLDFGIAKLALPEVEAGQEGEDDEEFRNLTMTGSTVGTPTYMSPEQAAGEEVDGRTDIYALGIIMYEMACGRPPFKSDNPVKLMRAHLFEEVPRLANDQLRGSRFEAVIRKALAKDKEERFEDAGAFEEALQMSAGRMLQEAEHLETHITPPEESDEHEAYDSEDLAFQRTAHYEIDNSDAATPRRDTGSLGSAAGSTDGASDESIPFDSMSSSEERERVAENATSSLTDGSDITSRSDLHEHNSPVAPAPEPSDASFDTGSSIVTVLEPGPDEEVILLTNAKDQAAESGAGEAASDDVTEADIADENGERGDARSDWEWGGRAGDAAQEPEVEVDFKGSRRRWVVALVVALVVCGLAVAYLTGWLPPS